MTQSITIGSSYVRVKASDFALMLQALQDASLLEGFGDQDVDFYMALQSVSFDYIITSEAGEPEEVDIFWGSSIDNDQLMDAVFTALAPWIPDRSFMSLIDNDANTQTYVFRGGKFIVLDQHTLVELLFEEDLVEKLFEQQARGDALREEMTTAREAEHGPFLTGCDWCGASPPQPCDTDCRNHPDNQDD